MECLRKVLRWPQGGPVCALNIPAGQWHTLRAVDSGTIILEVKGGKYEPVRQEDVL